MNTCTKCGARMKLQFGPFGPYLQCRRFSCDIRQVCDENGNPKYAQTDGPTRKARIAAHDAFDRIWKSKIMKRYAAYGWLAEKMGLTRDETHMHLFSISQCERVIEICKKEFPS